MWQKKFKRKIPSLDPSSKPGLPQGLVPKVSVHEEGLVAMRYRSQCLMFIIPLC